MNQKIDVKGEKTGIDCSATSILMYQMLVCTSMMQSLKVVIEWLTMNLITLCDVKLHHLNQSPFTYFGIPFCIASLVRRTSFTYDLSCT